VEAFVRAETSKPFSKLLVLTVIIAAAAVSASAQSLPTGWSHQDIGQVGLTGSASYSAGTFTVSGAGQGLNAGTADGVHFAYVSLDGDGAIVARVASLPMIESSAF
jgi:hypothetical protein